LVSRCGHLATEFKESFVLHDYLPQFAAARCLLAYIY
jgi:hypothetical protein